MATLMKNFSLLTTHLEKPPKECLQCYPGLSKVQPQTYYSYYQGPSPFSSLLFSCLTLFDLSQVNYKHIINYPLSTNNPQFSFSSEIT